MRFRQGHEHRTLGEWPRGHPASMARGGRRVVFPGKVEFVQQLAKRDAPTILSQHVVSEDDGPAQRCSNRVLALHLSQCLDTRGATLGQQRVRWDSPAGFCHNDISDGFAYIY